MNTDEDDGVTAWWCALLAASHSRLAAVDAAYQQLENADRINRVKVHAYLCAKRGCVLATVIRLGDVTIARTRDYRLAPATNLGRSVESARRTRTLDGDRHWPGHTFDVSDLATWGDAVGIDLNCRHALRVVSAADVLAACQGIRPGHPGSPTRL